jgi:AraC-like DNA-binding protein
VKQIMVCVGINDISHFARCFKDTFGVTPTGYRNGRSFSLLPETRGKNDSVIGNQPRGNGTLMS